MRCVFLPSASRAILWSIRTKLAFPKDSQENGVEREQPPQPKGEQHTRRQIESHSPSSNSRATNVLDYLISPLAAEARAARETHVGRTFNLLRPLLRRLCCIHKHASLRDASRLLMRSALSTVGLFTRTLLWLLLHFQACFQVIRIPCVEQDTSSSNDAAIMIQHSTTYTI